MNHSLKIAVLLLALLSMSLGCETAVEKTALKKAVKASETQSHVHEPGDELVWEVKEKIAETDFEIWLGHHGTHFHGGDTIEPSVAIVKGGEAYADAKVFNQLANPNDASLVLTEEVETVYEPATEDEIAHYAQGDLKIPNDASKCLIRFRLEIPGMPSILRDVVVEVGH